MSEKGGTLTDASVGGYQELYEIQAEARLNDDHETLRNTLDATEGNVLFRIPAGNLGYLNTEIARLNKRAARLGTTPITVTELERFTKTERVPAWTLGNGEVVDWKTIGRDYIIIGIEGETPRLNGWQFAATLIHDENGNTVRRMPSFDLEADLTAYRTADPSNCDHCKLDRRRTDTFVVYNADEGKTMQVGRQCLKDFLGFNDPLAIARHLERIQEFMGKIESDDEGGYNQRGPAMESTEYFLTHVATMIREFGWISKSQAGYEQTPTADAAMWNLLDYGKTNEYGKKLYVEYTDEDKAMATAALAHCREKFSKDSDNEFEYNMAVNLAGDFFNERNKGFVAYAVQAYLRDTQEQIEREVAAKNPSEHVGTVGERQVFNGLTVTAITAIESFYGVSDLHMFIDADGNKFKWFSSSKTLKVGETYNLKATVKKHDEYKGEKQTLITRATEV
jgi:hypothetical protein